MKLPRPFVLQALLLVLCIAIMVAYSPKLHAQSASGTAAAQPTVPQWQTDAGGKMSFDVASVKPSTGRIDTNINLSGLDDSPPNGGLFSANFPLNGYLLFAYKLSGDQLRQLQRQLPKWANTGLFDIEARAEGNPTRDQMRLMMQSLLADRFKLAVHFETQQLPVFALVLSKPGKMGPQLTPHTDDPPCGAPPTAGSAPIWPPPNCGALEGPGLVSGRERWGARNLTIEQIAGLFGGALLGNLGRPVLDETGLSGKRRFDFWIEYTPEPGGPLPRNFQPDATGPTFLEALQEQLGLKLVPQTGPVDVLVLDHIEEPSPN